MYVLRFTDQVLHVGLVSEGNRELRNAKWGTQEKPSGTAGSSKGQTQVLSLSLIYLFEIINNSQLLIFVVFLASMCSYTCSGANRMKCGPRTALAAVVLPMTTPALAMVMVPTSLPKHHRIQRLEMLIPIIGALNRSSALKRRILSPTTSPSQQAARLFGLELWLRKLGRK